MKPWTIGALLLAILAGQDDPRKVIAAAWEKLGTWCVSKKLHAEARAAAEEALAADPSSAPAKALIDAKGDGDAAESARKEYATRLAAVQKQTAGLWKQLATKAHADKDNTDHDGFWARALKADPKAIQPAYDAEWRAAIQKQDWTRAARLLAAEEAALGTDPDRAKALRDVEAKSSVTTPVLKKASTHEMRYFLSLPKGWDAAKKWPVLFVVDGAGSSFEAQTKRFAGYRGDVPVILAGLCTTSNTNAINKGKYPWYSQETIDGIEKSGRIRFDDAGLLAVIEDLQKNYAAEEHYFIAGYSGGGSLTWWQVFTRPARLRGAFPACANFYAKPAEAPEGGRDVPVRAFQGEKDGHLEMLNGQWKQAEALMKEWGYTNYSRTMLPEVGHTACHAPVFEAIKEILKK